MESLSVKVIEFEFSLSLSLSLSHSILAGQILKKFLVKIRSYFDNDPNWDFSR